MAVGEGSGADGLDGPVQVRSNLAGILADDPFNPPLTAGEVVTTGTMTRAFPVVPCERRSTAIPGHPLPGLSVVVG